MNAPAAPGRTAPVLTVGDRREILFRSFFLQTLWNFQKMQNAGWLFALWPALRRLYPDPAERRAVAKEHFEYFNTHPYCANIILGVVAGLEEERVRGTGVTREQIAGAKAAMSGPLAALGDTLFWATARPLVGVLAIVAGWMWVAESWWFVPVLFLAVYNALHLLVRVGGPSLGYHRKARVIETFAGLNLQRGIRAACLLGAGAAAGGVATLLAGFGPGRWAAAGFAAVALTLLRAGFSATQSVYLMTALGTGWALFAGT